MPTYRSRTTTHGRNMAGARGLWRATGMKNSDFGKPIIAVSNSFTQFVPGHVHLKDLGQLVAREIEAHGGVAKEFNTIAVDDGIAMGHDGMLYSLPSREIIADSVEYMVNAHCADALVCISNCDKITPGMLMAALRLNIPTVFVSGGPMEAGKTRLAGEEVPVNLISAILSSGDDSVSDDEVRLEGEDFLEVRLIGGPDFFRGLRRLGEVDRGTATGHGGAGVVDDAVERRQTGSGARQQQPGPAPCARARAPAAVATAGGRQGRQGQVQRGGLSNNA